MLKKLTGIKKAVGEYKRFNANGFYSPEYGYLSNSIINLGFMMQEQGIEINMKNVIEFQGN